MKYFAPFRFDDRAGVLSRAGHILPLTRKAADLLTCLLDSAGTLVSHQQLLQRVWPDTHVQPENIKALVHELRSALGDPSHRPLFIKSEPGRGYTFIAGVTDAMVPFLSDAAGEVRSDLLGRDREVAILDERLGLAAEQGTPQLVIVEGERGMGKTSLCEALVLRACRRPGIQISYGQGLEVWGPIQDCALLLDAFDLLARQYPAIVPPAFAKRAPSWLPRLTNWADCVADNESARPTGPEQGAERLMRELGAVLDELAANDPLLLVLEDLQWADPATIECLRVLGHRHARARLCVVATYCGSEESPAVEALRRVTRELEGANWCSVLALRPFSEAQLFGWLEARFSLAIARAICRPLYRAGGGNPALSTLVTDSLVRLGALHSTSGGWRLSPASDGVDALLATSLTGALQSQIDRLATADRCILEAAAALGPEFTADAVAASLQVDASFVEERLRSLASRHVLADIVGRRGRGSVGKHPLFRLRHPLAVDLLLDRAPLAERLHAAAAFGRAAETDRRRA
jgi:DNA-binding winged helix-turn-helix (wHTH) protein